MIQTKLSHIIAAMYIGQKCDVMWLYTDTLDGAFSKGDVWHDSKIHGAHIARLQRDEVKLTLHLRRLESMTEDEAREVYKIESGEAWNTQMYSQDEPLNGSCLDKWWNTLLEDVYVQNSELRVGTPAVWLYLLSKGFDLFGLIDAGLAKEI